MLPLLIKLSSIEKISFSDLFDSFLNKSIENDNTSNKMSLTTQTTSLVNYQTRLRKKTQDMRNLQFYLAFIQYPSISQLQSDNELVINNIRDTIQNGLPIYKTNLTTILGALRTRKAIEQTKAVREVINKQISLAVDMVQKNAEDISKSAMETTIDTQVIIDAARKMQETHEKLSVVRNEAVKAFDEQSKALEEATNKINNHLKIVGGVSAVKAAVDAASIAAERVCQVVSKHVIARPSDELDKIIKDGELVAASSVDLMNNNLINS